MRMQEHLPGEPAASKRFVQVGLCVPVGVMWLLLCAHSLAAQTQRSVRAAERELARALRYQLPQRPLLQFAFWKTKTEQIIKYIILFLFFKLK